MLKEIYILQENERSREMISSTNSDVGYQHVLPQRYHHQNTRRIPPEVPKRTSSISLHCATPTLAKTSDSGSLSSVQSSGSDTTIAPSQQTSWEKKPQVNFLKVLLLTYLFPVFILAVGILCVRELKIIINA